MQIIRKNFLLKLLALTLAIVGWAYIRFAGNPAIAQQLRNLVIQRAPQPCTSATILPTQPK
jgi:hypothetical protein